MLTFTCWNILRIFFICCEGFQSRLEYGTFALGTLVWGWDEKVGEHDGSGEEEEMNYGLVYWMIGVTLGNMATVLFTCLLDLSICMVLYWWTCDITNQVEFELRFIIGWLGKISGPAHLVMWLTDQSTTLNSWSIENLQAVVG